MEISGKPTKSIVDTMNEAREQFEREYGRLLTEEEAIELTNQIRKNIDKKNSINSISPAYQQ